jgi:hypothetical protein
MPTRTTWTYTLIVIAGPADNPREVDESELVGAIQDAVSINVGNLLGPVRLEVSVERQDVRIDTEV